MPSKCTIFSSVFFALVGQAGLAALVYSILENIIFGTYRHRIIVHPYLGFFALPNPLLHRLGHDEQVIQLYTTLKTRCSEVTSHIWHFESARILEPIIQPYMAILEQLELVRSGSEPLSRQMAWLGPIMAWLGFRAVWSRVSGSTSYQSQ
jgi:hypothetical protein